MKQSRVRPGKTFYSLFALLIIFTYVPILIALALAQQSLNFSHQQQLSLLVASLENQLQYIRDVSPGGNHPEQVASLQEYTFLESLGTAEDLTYGEEIEQAEQALLTVIPSVEPEVLSAYLYFPNSNYLINSNQLGGNALDSVSATALLGVNALNEQLIGSGRKYYYQDPDDTVGQHSIFTATIFPGVIFITDVYSGLDASSDVNSDQQDRLMMAKLAESLQDVEICTFDSYGNYQLNYGTEDLCSQYNYTMLDSEEDGYFSFSEGGHFYLCCYTYNQDDMTKLALFCRDQTAEGIARTTVLLWVSGGLFLLLILVMALFCVRRTYRPIRSMMHRLHAEENEGGDKPILRDEFAAMNRAMDSIDRQLDQRNRILEKYYMIRILHGNRPELLDSYTDRWEQQQDQHRFAVAVLHVDETVGEKLPEEPDLEQELQAFLEGKNMDVRIVSDEDFIDLVFRLAMNATVSGLLELCQNLQSRMTRYCLSIFVSSLYPAMTDLRWGYSEAMIAAEYYISNDRINIIAGADTVPASYEKGQSEIPNFNLLKKLSDCIATLNPEETEQTFDRLADQIGPGLDPAAGGDSPALSIMVNSICLALFDTGLVNQEFMADEVDRIRHTTSMRDLRSLIHQTLTKLT